MLIKYLENKEDGDTHLPNSGKKIKQGLIYRSAAFSFYDGVTGPILEETKNLFQNIN